MAFREEISSAPLLVDITWQTNAQPYEFGNEKKKYPLRLSLIFSFVQEELKRQVTVVLRPAEDFYGNTI